MREDQTQIENYISYLFNLISIRNALLRRLKSLLAFAFFFVSIAGALAQGFAVSGKVVDENN